jgi:hypothetical protein
MPATVYTVHSDWQAPPERLGPAGPFPDISMRGPLERRWLHYAFLSRGNDLGLVANIAWLGPDDEPGGAGPRATSILLLHKEGRGWRSSQFNARTPSIPWSAFRQPHSFDADGTFALQSTADTVAVNLRLRRSSRPCTSQCATFANDHFLRWQSETGVIARGDWTYGDTLSRNVEAIGYHERVRGRWGWPELGGWVFGFANDPDWENNSAPPHAVVFTLLQPLTPHDAATGSVMLWRNGKLVRHFPRRRVDVAVQGLLDRNAVVNVPHLANLFSVPAMSPIPARLVISAAMGHDSVMLDFHCDEAARVVIPSETGILPFSVHEVIGRVTVEGNAGGDRFRFETRGIVEFAGGAGGD